MGTCVSNHEEIVKELKKYDNNALILEHLKQNQENFVALTKSFNQIATLNRSEPNLAIRSDHSISPCHQQHCNCHCNYVETGNFAKSLLLVSLNNRENNSKLQYAEAPRKIKYDVIDNESDTTTDGTVEENSSTTVDSQYQNYSKGSNMNEKYIGIQKVKENSIAPHNSLKKVQSSKLKHYKQAKQRHFHCKHLNSSPSRHLIIVNNNNSNSSTLSSSCESLQSNRRFYNEIDYDNSHFDRSITSKSKLKAHKNSRSNSAHNKDSVCIQNYGAFCSTVNCRKCQYALSVLEQTNLKNNSYIVDKDSLYDTRRIRGHVKKIKKRSESSYHNVNNYESSKNDRSGRKSVNFLNSTARHDFSEYDSEVDANGNFLQKNFNHLNYDPGNGLKEFIERQESRTTSRNQQVTNNLSIYDNLNEFNSYLNKKIMDKHLQVKRAELMDLDCIAKRDKIDSQPVTSNHKYDISGNLIFR